MVRTRTSIVTTPRTRLPRTTVSALRVQVLALARAILAVVVGALLAVRADLVSSLNA